MPHQFITDPTHFLASVVLVALVLLASRLGRDALRHPTERSGR